ncbi:DUF4276 family protein [Corynebacterium phoceense]|uniref:DUF4276 family protein n=2 Tax=Corynebacteriaceae TaxID=1653 RepID=UPI00211CFE4B|nr:DUF4276 family protein [Corynebacterium phoceense]MCQ9341523.1 DUF4276 family protein [Corynebacterium phoceense]
MLINYVVEGNSDKGAVLALLKATGHQPAHSFVKRGYAQLDKHTPGYARAAELDPSTGWLVLRDSDGACPVELRARLSTPTVPSFFYRVACTMTKAWLLGDADGISEYFSIPRRAIPREPEALVHAKRTLLSLVHEYAPRELKEEFVSTLGTQVRMGPLFADHLTEFGRDHWDIDAARQHCPSLQRAWLRLTAAASSSTAR